VTEKQNGTVGKSTLTLQVALLSGSRQWLGFFSSQ